MISWMSSIYEGITLFLYENRCHLGLSESGEVLTDRRTSERRIMQVSSSVRDSVSSRYYTQYQTNKSVKYFAGFTKTEDGKLTSGEKSTQDLTEKPGFAKFVDYQEFHKAWMSQRATSIRGYVTDDATENVVVQTESVSIAETEDAGEFLGLTMVPEEGQAVTYGMRAVLSEKSTPENPIVQVISNLGGQKVIYNVEVNKVNPNNATQLEMFALLGYTDKMGITDGGTFGSHQQLEVYGGNASSIGYCGNLSGADVFLNEKFNWTSIMEKMVQVYMDAKVENQAEDCKALFEFFKTYAKQDKAKAFVEASEETQDYTKILKEKMNEIIDKIKNGDTEVSYQIGAQSFTEKEWEELLEKFDSIEEAIQKLMKEEQAKKEAEEAHKEDGITNDASTLLTTESTSCEYETADSKDDDIRYITWYTKEGIFCRKAGQTEGYEWSIPFENREQYDKVMEFIGQFPSDWNMRFAAHENFWMDFLNDKIDIKEFMEFIGGTNKGVPDFSITVGDSMYVDKDKAQWAKYTNPLGARFYTAEELHQIQMEMLGI